MSLSPQRRRKTPRVRKHLRPVKLLLERLEDRLAPNAAPLAPVITEPVRDDIIVSAANVHMETAAFMDPDPPATPDGQHLNTDWFIYRRNFPSPGQEELVWQTLAIGGVERLHTHLGDGQFLGSHAGRSDLLPETDYLLRVRHRDASGDPPTSTSPLSERRFRTGTVIIGSPDQRWTVTQPGYVVETVATNFQLPVNIAFLPNPGTNPTDPFYYVTELYGIIKVVSRNGTVSNYATNLLNYNPTGAFPGSGEQGLTGITVDPISGDVFASMVYSQVPFSDTSPHFYKVVRFHSNDGGRTAATQTTIFDPATLPGFSASLESQGQSHQVSNVSIGPDGFLYVHNGEGFDASRAQNLSSTGGKILRMTFTGQAPTDNPFYNAGDGITARDFVFATGFRNPFGGAWRAADNRHYTVENGPGSNDRLTQLVAGRNYGWNGTDASLTTFATYLWNPVTAPVNIAFVQPQTFGGSQLPAGNQDHAFVSLSGPTYAAGPQANGKFIQEFTFNPDGTLAGAPTTLLRYTGTGRGTVVGMAAGPDGLYFTDLYRDDGVGGPTARGANVLRVRFGGGVDFTADVTASCEPPLTVRFTDQSSIPGVTEYFWDFGDGSHSHDRNPVHTYTQAGTFSVTLTVTSPAGVRTLQRTNYIGVGSGGLQAEYFTNVTLSGAPALRRIDPTVNFDFGTGSPHASIPADNFSARWTGHVRPLFTETYTFLTTSDDGVRLFVNEQQIINNFTDHGPTVDMGTISLVAGQEYTIRLEWYERGGGAVIRMEWQSPSQVRQIIPATRLCPGSQSFAAHINFTTATGELVPNYINDAGLAFGDRGSGLSFGWNQDNSANARDRDDATSPSELHDSLNHMQRPDNPNAFWEIAVPNGTYSVRLIAGDPIAFDSIYRLNVEGVLAIDATPTTTTRWFENTITATVSDGRLTVSNAAGSSNNKINAIDLTQLVPAQTLRVFAFASTTTGFTAQFNRPLDRSVLSLYETQTGGLGPPDVTLVGASTGAVPGSLVVNSAATGITFVRTGETLPPDFYTVTLRSAANGFRDTSGALLDGNADGTPGGDYTNTFTVTSSAAVVVRALEFARGPGQPVDLPAAGSGLPLTLSNGANVTTVNLTLQYDPSLLLLIGATVGTGAPTGATVSLNTATQGSVTLTFTSPTALPAGAIDFVRLSAVVPSSAVYRSTHVLNLTAVQINGGAIAAVDDDGLHAVAYVGDATGNAAYSSADATLLQRVSVGLNTGFATYPTTDPVAIADITGNGQVGSTDAARLLQESVGMDRSEVPPTPGVNFRNGFAGTTGLQLNGTTQLVDSKLRLTNGGTSQAASAFTSSRVDARRFSVSFSFQLTNAVADGLAFVLQGIGANALGSLGGGLGYSFDPATGQGPTIGSSVAVKFDLYDNAGEGNNSTGLYTNGAQPTVPAINLNPFGIDFHNGRIFNVVMTYDGTTLRVTMADSVSNASATQSYLINISGTVGGDLAFVGFTAGTGGLSATQDILNWTYTSL